MTVRVRRRPQPLITDRTDYPGTLAVSGTSKGWTPQQKETFETVITQIAPRRVRHGKCIGVDAQAHEVIRRLLPDCWIELHPVNRPGKVADVRGDKEHPPMDDPIARNHVMVRLEPLLVAIPRTYRLTRRGGTAPTIRYALAQGKPVIAIWPDGSIEPNPARLIREGLTP